MLHLSLEPLDGSAAAERSLHEAIELAAPLVARLSLLHVIDRHPTFVEHARAVAFQQSMQILHFHGEELLAQAATGQATALRRIGGNLASIERRPGRVQLALKAVVAREAVKASVVSVCAALLYAYRQGARTEGLLAGLTLAMAIIPEEFAVVRAVMLSLGAWRQAQAIETLGTTTVLCVDKTGTLTENRMQRVTLALPMRQVDLLPDARPDAAFADLLAVAARASIENGIEPMDQAIFRVAGRSHGVPSLPAQLLGRECVASGRPWVSARWRLPEGGGELLAIKGAPEAVLDLCEMAPAERIQRSADAERLSAQGLRVLGVARAHPVPVPGPGPEDALNVWTS